MYDRDGQAEYLIEALKNCGVEDEYLIEALKNCGVEDVSVKKLWEDMMNRYICEQNKEVEEEDKEYFKEKLYTAFVNSVVKSVKQEKNKPLVFTIKQPKIGMK